MRILFTLLLLLCFSFFGFSQMNFLINEGTAGSNEEFYHSAQTKDGNLVAVGYTDINDVNWDMLIFKVDLNGIRLWTKTIATSGYDEAFGVVATSDGGFAVSGSLNNKMTILKFDAAGNLEWNKQYSELLTSDATRLYLTSDGGYFLPGYVTVNETSGISQSYLIKTDAEGNVQWSKKYFAATGISLIYDIKKTADDNYAFLATNSGSNDTTCVVKINPGGDVIWARNFYDNESFTNGYSLVTTSDGGCIVTGVRENLSSNAFILKFNAAGTKLWSKSTNSDGVADLAFNACVVGTTGGYAFMGSGSTADSNFYYLIKINTSGDLIWTKTVKKASNDTQGTYYSVINTKEGGYLVTGSVRDATGTLDGALLKFDVNFSNCRPSTGIFGSLKDYGTVSNASVSVVSGDPTVTTTLPSISATTNYVLICTALPLNLVSFTAFPQNNKVQLQWKTSQEINTSYFDIEKSQDGKGFTAFKQVAAAGNSSLALTYNATDDAPLPGKSWYRLKMVDKDGEYAYSNMIAVTTDVHKGISINPNPVGNVLNLYIQSDAATNAELLITDINGKGLSQNKAVVAAGSNSIKVDVSRFAKGVYFIKIKQGTSTQTLKWIKQ